MRALVIPVQQSNNPIKARLYRMEKFVVIIYNIVGVTAILTFLSVFSCQKHDGHTVAISASLLPLAVEC